MRISDWSSDVCSSDLWSTAIGGSTFAGGENAVALGFYAQALGDNSVALGTGSVADRAIAVSVGAGTNIDDFVEEGQYPHVAAGSGDQAAVNPHSIGKQRRGQGRGQLG